MVFTTGEFAVKFPHVTLAPRLLPFHTWVRGIGTPDGVDRISSGPEILIPQRNTRDAR